MLKFFLRFQLFFLVTFLCIPAFANAQIIVPINDTAKQHIFKYTEISFLEDTTARITFDQVRLPGILQKFKPNKTATPVTNHPNSAYWYRITIKHNRDSKNNWILEFFDQTIDSITVYSPDNKNQYFATLLGSDRPFTARLYQHKNFSFSLNNTLSGDKTYYIRIKSHQSVN